MFLAKITDARYTIVYYPGAYLNTICREAIENYLDARKNVLNPEKWDVFIQYAGLAERSQAMMKDECIAADERFPTASQVNYNGRKDNSSIYKYSK